MILDYNVVMPLVMSEASVFVGTKPGKSVCLFVCVCVCVYVCVYVRTVCHYCYDHSVIVCHMFAPSLTDQSSAMLSLCKSLANNALHQLALNWTLMVSRSSKLPFSFSKNRNYFVGNKFVYFSLTSDNQNWQLFC